LNLTQAVDAEHARRVAEDVLDGDRFQADPSPRPLRGPLEWLGDRLRDVFEPIGRALASLPGPTWVPVVALLGAVVALLLWRYAPRRERLASGERVARPRATTDVSAADLEAAAARAERAGDRDLALRLRFRAGLLRLDEVGAIELGPGVTTTEMRARVRSGVFDELADDFEAVAYSEHLASEDELVAAKHGWPVVVREARRA
jgi:hypothetical protein